MFDMIQFLFYSKLKRIIKINLLREIIENY